MKELKIVDVNVSLSAENDRYAAEVRRQNQANQTMLVNIMASPGSGKTTTLLETIARLKDEYRIGVMEADIDDSIDARKMYTQGVPAIQLHTGGECAMDASMTLQGMECFHTEDLDLVFLENVGNLVCPAEQDTGADLNVEILSVPEGDDKPLKYPLMFQVCQVVLINKIDTKEYFPFDDGIVAERIHAINPDAKIFFISAKTGEGMDAWISYLREQITQRLG